MNKIFYQKCAIPIIILLLGLAMASCKAENSKREGEVKEDNASGKQEVKIENELEENENPAEQKQLFDIYIEQIDQLLEESRELENECNTYREFVGSIYLFSKAYSGGLQAFYDENGIVSYQMALTLEDESKNDKQKYICYPLSDGSFWFTYETTREIEKDLPDYTVNEDVLRYMRLDYIYDDGSVDLSEVKVEREQNLQQILTEKINGQVLEFWCSDEKVYQIDRENGIFIDATEGGEFYIASFLKQQQNHMIQQFNVDETVLDEVEKWKPEGYCLLGDWNEIAVCDVNHDGFMDYVMALYPKDYKEERRYADNSPYEKSSQYYAAGFWLILSNGAEDYKQIQLSDSVEYWETALVLVEVSFIEDGILELEYFIGRSPWSNAVLWFKYSEEDQNFYIFRSYYRQFEEEMLIGDEDNYGKLSLYAYFGWPLHYYEGIWDSDDDIPLNEGNQLGYYSDSFQYRCDNPILEHRINSLIWKSEYDLLQQIQEKCSNVSLDLSLIAEPLFYNQKLVSGNMEFYGSGKSIENNSDIRVGGDGQEIPIMLDKQTGEYVKVTELIDKEEFMQIFHAWADENSGSDGITIIERMRCDIVIEQAWEKADALSNCIAEDDEILLLQITQEGVRMGVWINSEIKMCYYMIDKEYFIGTYLWDYLKPEW